MQSADHFKNKKDTKIDFDRYSNTSVIINDVDYHKHKQLSHSEIPLNFITT